MDDVRKRFAEYKRQRRQDTASTREGTGHEEDKSTPRQPSECTTSTTHVSTPPQHSHDAPDIAPLPSNNPEHLAPDASPLPSPTPIYTTLLKLILWALVWGFFIEVGFGAVFFITSLLYFIIVSLRGSRRKPWEPSAYSVFNRNFEAIDGTLSAEQFERELRYGPMSVRK